MNIRKLLQELSISLQHHGDPRLLQHDLGYPDPVRRPCPAPGQSALMLVVPLEQMLLESGDVEGKHLTGTYHAQLCEQKRKEHRPFGAVLPGLYPPPGTSPKLNQQPRLGRWC